MEKLDSKGSMENLTEDRGGTGFFLGPKDTEVHTVEGTGRVQWMEVSGK